MMLHIYFQIQATCYFESHQSRRSERGGSEPAGLHGFREEFPEARAEPWKAKRS